MHLQTIDFAEDLKNAALSDVGVVVYSLLAQLGDSLNPDMLLDRSAPFFAWVHARNVPSLAHPHVGVEVVVVGKSKGRKRHSTASAGSSGNGSVASGCIDIVPSGVATCSSKEEGESHVFMTLDVEVWVSQSRGIDSGLIIIFNVPVNTENSTCSVQQTRGVVFTVCYRAAGAQEKTISSLMNLSDLCAVDGIIAAQVPSSFYEPVDLGCSFLSSASTVSSPAADDSLDTTLDHERTQLRDFILRQDNALQRLAKHSG